MCILFLLIDQATLVWYKQMGCAARAFLKKIKKEKFLDNIRAINESFAIDAKVECRCQPPGLLRLIFRSKIR